MSPLFAILKTAVFMLEATKISLIVSLCWTINATSILFSFITSSLSVLYTIVSSVVLSPKTIKLELIVKFPLINKLLS